MSIEIRIEQERPSDRDDILALSSAAHGPGRFARTAYRVREGAALAPELSLVARIEGRLAGSIRFSRTAIGGHEHAALLLGPLAVDPVYAGQGLGRKLIETGTEMAKSAGYALVLLVGDLAYYQRFGFVRVPPGQITLPGPVDPARLLAKELSEGALAGVRGMVRGPGSE